MKNIKDLILFIFILTMGAGASSIPIAFPKLEKEVKLQYMGFTTACLTLVATAYQANKNDIND